MLVPVPLLIICKRIILPSIWLITKTVWEVPQLLEANSYLRNNAGQVLINPSNGLPIINQNFLPIGDRNPDFSIGFSNQFRYKQLRLSVLLDIRKGGDVFNGTAMYLWRTGLHPKSLDRDTPMTFPGVL